MDTIADKLRGPAPISGWTGLDVWEIVDVLKDNDGSVEDAATYLEVDPRHVQTATRYYADNQEEIDAWRSRVHELNEGEEAHWRGRPRS